MIIIGQIITTVCHSYPSLFSNLNDLVLELFIKVTNSIEVHFLSYIHLITELNRFTETEAQI